MNKDEKMQLLAEVSSGIAAMMGDTVEVVVHDIEKKEIYSIENGYITGRKKGYKVNQSTFDVIIELGKKKSQLIGYSSQSEGGRPLRSSHLMFKEEDGTPYALICINQDLTEYYKMKKYIDSVTDIKHIENEEKNEAVLLDTEPYVHQVMQKAIINAFERAKPSDLSTKNAKIRIIKDLKNQGVFEIKDAVLYVCNALSISQATLYNYLREIRNE